MQFRLTLKDISYIIQNLTSFCSVLHLKIELNPNTPPSGGGSRNYKTIDVANILMAASVFI